MLLGGFMSMPCAGTLPLATLKRGPLRSCLGCGSARRWGICQVGKGMPPLGSRWMLRCRRGALGADTCLEGEAPWERLKGSDISTCPSNMWYETTSTPWSSRGLAHRVAWQAERKSSWPLLSSLITCSSRCWMDSTCTCWSEPAWEAPLASTSLMVLEQRVSASWVEWAHMALASLIDSVVLESFWQRAMPSSQTNFCLWVLMDALVTSSPPRALLASS